MKYAIPAAVAVALALSAGTASAQTEDNDSGFYLGAGVGQFNVKIDDIDDTDEAVQSLDDSDRSWKGFIGWRFNKYIAVEAAWIDFGEATDDFSSSGTSGDYRVRVSGIAPYVIGTIPLGPVELFGKAGYYFYDVDASTDLDQPLSPSFNSKSSEQDFVYGAGVGVTFLQHLNVRLEYERIDSDVIDDADALWLSGAWRF